MVLAGDLLYWVSLRDRSIRYTDPHALEVRGVPGRPIVAVAGYHEVRLISSAGLLWRRELISCDPITLTDSTHDRVTGIVESLDGRVPFEIDLESMQLRGGIAPPEDDFWSPPRTSANASATGSLPPIDQQRTGWSWTAWLWEIATLLFGILVAVQGYDLYGWTFAGPWLAMVPIRSTIHLAAFSTQ